MQSGEYILSPDFVSQFRKVGLEETQSFWTIVHDPEATTAAMIMKLAFDPNWVNNINCDSLQMDVITKHALVISLRCRHPLLAVRPLLVSLILKTRI